MMIIYKKFIKMIKWNNKLKKKNKKKVLTMRNTKVFIFKIIFI